MNLGEIEKCLGELRDWNIEFGDSIAKVYDFKDFNESLWFVNKVAEIAEKAQHHPSITIDFGMVKIVLRTHSIKGITEKDFEVAKEIDKI